MELEPGLSIFQGENGQGKSNLLEAAYLLAIARSPRSSNDRELVNRDVAQLGGHVQVLGVGRERDFIVRAQMDIEVSAPGNMGSPPMRKSLRVNGVLRTAGEFVGNMNIVFFEASDLEIITGAPSFRRRYLDILISQSDAVYLKNRQRYSRVVAQRNQLLRRVREGRAEIDELEFWDGRLAHEGAAIVERRNRAVADLAQYAIPTHQKLSGGGMLSLTYRPRLTVSEGPIRDISDIGAAAIAADILNALRAARGREVAQGMSIIGPHRDDLKIRLDGQQAGAYSSRGQARSIALALKLAEAAVVADSAGRTPVLALDDVLSELDANRRRLVLEEVSVYDQTLLTTTDLALIEAQYLSGAKRFTVHRGTVRAHAA